MLHFIDFVDQLEDGKAIDLVHAAGQGLEELRGSCQEFNRV